MLYLKFLFTKHIGKYRRLPLLLWYKILAIFYIMIGSRDMALVYDARALMCSPRNNLFNIPVDGSYFFINARIRNDKELDETEFDRLITRMKKQFVSYVAWHDEFNGPDGLVPLLDLLKESGDITAAEYVKYLQYDWNKIVAANAATLVVKSRPIKEAKDV